jgi:hypothetical protein
MKQIISPIVKERLKQLHPCQNEEILLRNFYQKKLKMAGMTILVGFILGMALLISNLVNGKISENGDILRENYNGKTIEIPVTVYSEQYDAVDMNITVEPLAYSEEEAEELFDQAQDWLMQVMPGENEALTCVRSDLVFPTVYEGTDISMTYSSSSYGLIDESGKVKNEELEKEESVQIHVVFSCGEYTREKEYEVMVYPPQYDLQEQFQKDLEELLSLENLQQKEKELFHLPEQVGEEEIVFQEKTDKRFLYIIFLSWLCAAFLYKGMDRDLDKLCEKRKQKLLFSYPEFVSKLALLTGAGMSVTGGIRKIYAEITNHQEPLYEELGIFVRSLDNGMLEEQALEELGKRNGIPQYRKFCSLLSANLKKGSMNLSDLLEKEAQEAFLEHQSHIRKLGEEAGTKLLLPMIMMLAVVMVIIIVPAFMTYQIS